MLLDQQKKQHQKTQLECPIVSYFNLIIGSFISQYIYIVYHIFYSFTLSYTSTYPRYFKRITNFLK